MKEAKFNNVNLEGSKFTDINFKNGSITESCVDGLMVWGHNVQELIEFKKTSLADQESRAKRLSEKIVEEFVGQAHGGYDRVAELLAEYPALLLTLPGIGAAEIGRRLSVRHLTWGGETSPSF